MSARTSDPGTSQAAVDPAGERRLKQLVLEAYELLGTDGGNRNSVKELTSLELDSISPRHEQLRNDRKLVRTGEDKDGCEVHIHIDYATSSHLLIEAKRIDDDNAKRIERANNALRKAEDRAAIDAQRAAWLRTKATEMDMGL